MQGDNPVIALYENKEAKESFQEVPLQYSYSLSDISHQVRSTCFLHPHHS